MSLNRLPVNGSLDGTTVYDLVVVFSVKFRLNQQINNMVDVFVVGREMVTVQFGEISTKTLVCACVLYSI